MRRFFIPHYTAFFAALEHKKRISQSIYAHTQTHPARWLGIDPESRICPDWWNDLARWCEPHEQHSQSAVLRGLLDLIVDRPTEYAAFVSLVEIVWNRALTNAQIEAEALRLEAQHLGINPAVYIAHRRGTSLQAAYALMRRADGRKMLKLETISSVIDDSQKNPYRPSEAEIASQLKEMKVICAGGGTRCLGEAPAQYGICWNCLHEFGRPGERDEYTARWLEPEIRRIKAQAKREARNQLYAEHAGLVDSPQEYEAVTEVV